jgi:hypothetical protein
MNVYVISTVIVEIKKEKNLGFTQIPVLGTHTNKKKAMDHFLAIKEDREKISLSVKEKELSHPIHRSKELKVIVVDYPEYKEEIRLEQWADTVYKQKKS